MTSPDSRHQRKIEPERAKAPLRTVIGRVSLSYGIVRDDLDCGHSIEVQRNRGVKVKRRCPQCAEGDR